MKQLWKRLKSEWEIALFLLAAVALGAALAVGWMRLDVDAEDHASRKMAKRQPSLLADDPYAFLRDLPVPENEAPSPFTFEGMLKAPKSPDRVKTVRVKPPKRLPPKPVPEIAKPEPPKPVEPVLPATVKRRVYGTRVVTYLYNARAASGRPAATIQVADPTARQDVTPVVVPIGGIVDGIKVLSFDERRLIIMDARGRRHQINFGKSSRVSSTPRIVEVPR